MSAVLTIVGSSAEPRLNQPRRSGFLVHAADMFADVDLRQVSEARQVDAYPVGLGQAIRGSQPGSWMYTGALENHPELIAQWQDIRPLLGNRAEVVRRIRDPNLVGDALRKAGLAAPAVRWDAAKLPRDGAWLAKPRRSAGGARIARLDENWRDLSSTPDEFYLQQRIDGTSVAAVFLATARDVMLIGVTNQLCGTRWGGDSDYRYCGSMGPVQVAPQVIARFQRIGEALHRSFELVGLFGVDAILQGETVWPVEVNPRYTASIEVIERATGFDAVTAHVAACRDGALPEVPAPNRQSGKLIVWAKGKCLFPSTGNLPAELGASRTSPTLADIPATETVIEAGWPIATVLADANCAASVAELLMCRAATLRECCPSV